MADSHFDNFQKKTSKICSETKKPTIVSPAFLSAVTANKNVICRVYVHLHVKTDTFYVKHEFESVSKNKELERENG